MQLALNCEPVLYLKSDEFLAQKVKHVGQGGALHLSKGFLNKRLLRGKTIHNGLVRQAAVKQFLWRCVDCETNLLKIKAHLDWDLIENFVP